MDDSLMKFLVDLGSIGAICVVCYFFCSCMYKMVVKFIEYITSQNDKQNEERRFYMDTLIDTIKDLLKK